MPVHQMRNVRLRNTKNISLFKLFGLHNFIDTKADLCLRKKLVRILQPQIRKDVPAAFFKFDFLILHVFRVPWPHCTAA